MTLRSFCEKRGRSLLKLTMDRFLSISSGVRSPEDGLLEGPPWTAKLSMCTTSRLLATSFRKAPHEA